jgi:protein-disulfide isomerase
MKLAVTVAAGLAVALTLSACDWAPSSDKVFGERVRAYLISHPEVLQEASDALQARRDTEARLALAASVAKSEQLVPQYRAAIEHDARDFVANPGGKVTVTEFFDYRCPHCVNIAPKVMTLIQQSPDVRFVFKEMPIFGPRSEHAARAALAVRKAGGDYLGFYRALMEGQNPEEEYDRLAIAKGARPEDLTVPASVDEAKRQVADTQALFSRLALGGTPAFVIGDTVVAGEDMAAVKAAIAKSGGKVTPEPGPPAL